METKEDLIKKLKDLTQQVDYIATELFHLLTWLEGDIPLPGLRPRSRDEFVDTLGNELEGFKDKRTVFALAMKARKSGLDEGRIVAMIQRWRTNGLMQKPVGYYASAFRDECYTFDQEDDDGGDLVDGFVFPTGEVWDAQLGKRVAPDDHPRRVGSGVCDEAGAEDLPGGTKGETSHTGWRLQ